jgi:hypothetical protein
MKWVTRERPKIDRLACPWLIKRFIDEHAEILYVPANQVRRVAQEINAIPFDIPDVELGHEGERCSFDAFLKKHAITDPALHHLAQIVRAADTDRLDDSREAPGLLAITLGLNANIQDDQRLLETALPLYDALYTWCRSLVGEHHGWNPDQLRTEMSA